MDSDLINHWSINNNTDDIVGNSHISCIVNCNLTKVRFNNLNSALSFRNGYATVPTGVYFNGDLTIAAWVKVYSVGLWSRLLDFSYNPGVDSIFLSLTNRESGYPVFSISNLNDYTDVNSQIILPLNVWIHFMGILNGTNGKLYLNWTEVGSNSNMRIPKNISRSKCYIGKSIWNTDAYANADFDDIRIYKRALSLEEINYLKFIDQN